jgi:hypothetical protein
LTAVALLVAALFILSSLLFNLMNKEQLIDKWQKKADWLKNQTDYFHKQIMSGDFKSGYSLSDLEFKQNAYLKQLNTINDFISDLKNMKQWKK